MGIIMAVGVSISNGVLMVASAEQRRKAGVSPSGRARGRVAARAPHPDDDAGDARGMLPMAVKHGRGDSAAGARAVLRGLSASTLVVLFVLPLAFAYGRRGSVPTTSKSLDPFRCGVNTMRWSCLKCVREPSAGLSCWPRGLVSVSACRTAEAPARLPRPRNPSAWAAQGCRVGLPSARAEADGGPDRGRLREVNSYVEAPARRHQLRRPQGDLGS